MKKILCILAAVLTCLLCLAGPAAADVIEFTDSYFTDMTAIGGTVYLRTNRAGVYSYRPGDPALTKYADGYGFPRYTGLVAVDGVLYTVDMEKEQFAAVGENAQGAPLDGAVIPNFRKTARLGEGWSIHSMQHTPFGLFWMLFPSHYTDKHTLCRLDTDTMELSCRAVPHLYNYCVQDDGTIWIVQQAEGRFILSAYDWESKTLTEAGDLPKGATGIVMQGDDMIFNVKRGRIIRRIPDGTIEDVMQIPIRQHNHINSLLLDGNWLVSVDQAQLSCQRLGDSET